MLLSKKSVELLAPAGTWEVLEAAIAAGADAVYLGGKRFNMRMHRTDTNFDDDLLKKAIEYAHAHGVRLYITVNNLISDREIEPMRDYLKFLQTIQLLQTQKKHSEKTPMKSKIGASSLIMPKPNCPRRKTHSLMSQIK